MEMKMLEIVKEWRVQLLCVALLFTAVVATAEANEQPPEEIVVTGIKLDIEEKSDLAAIGLSGIYLIHIYDEMRDEWRFVRASNEEKENESTN